MAETADQWFHRLTYLVELASNGGFVLLTGMHICISEMLSFLSRKVGSNGRIPSSSFSNSFYLFKGGSSNLLPLLKVGLMVIQNIKVILAKNMLEGKMDQSSLCLGI